MPETPEAGRDPRLAGFQIVAGMVALMWALEVIDVIAGHRLDRAGIEPHEADGLAGIIAAPFLHAGFGHLISNTLPFLTMGIVIAFQGAARVLAVTALVAVVSGLGTWLFGQEGTLHIGASGVVFGYATYLIARAFYTRRMLHLATGLLVLGLFGTTLLFGLVPTPGVSWQGHLFGALAGVLAARLLDARRPERAPEPALA